MKDEIKRFHFKQFFKQNFHVTHFKTDTENNFDLFSATFSPISIIQGLFFNIFNIDIWSKRLLDVPIISLNKFQRKIFFFIFQFLDFLAIFQIYIKFQHISAKNYISKFGTFYFRGKFLTWCNNLEIILETKCHKPHKKILGRFRVMIFCYIKSLYVIE